MQDEKIIKQGISVTLCEYKREIMPHITRHELAKLPSKLIFSEDLPASQGGTCIFVKG